ncbi:MAG TPA: hypothetical protein PKA64_14080, partial [Myxococcota bacterium]|nr:hypothetical protein [Myxococcota bacterium]
MTLSHPALVHVPLGLSVGLPLLAVALLALTWTGRLPHRAWLLAAGLQLVVTGAGKVAEELGERDEEHAERMAPESAIHEHEELAEQFLASSAIPLVLLGLAGGLPAGQLARGAAVLGTLGTLVTAGAGYRVGHAGGEL